MERKIVFSESIKIYLNELVDILHSQKYFSFKKDAQMYVRQIVMFINNYDFEINVKESPVKYRKFGKRYIRYKANNKTSWYILFDQKNNQFIINHIINNHSLDFPELL